MQSVADEWNPLYRNRAGWWGKHYDRDPRTWGQRQEEWRTALHGLREQIGAVQVDIGNVVADAIRSFNP